MSTSQTLVLNVEHPLTVNGDILWAVSRELSATPMSAPIVVLTVQVKDGDLEITRQDGI